MGIQPQKSNGSASDSSVQKDRRNRKQKKSKKQKKRSYSSSPQQKNKKSSSRRDRDRDRQRDRTNDKYRQRSYQRQRNKKKNKDRKYRDSKQRRSKQRERSRSKDNDKNKKKQVKQVKQPVKKQPEVKKSKSKSPSPQTKKPLTEQERQRKMAMRKVRARLLKLNDMLDGGDSDSDSDKEQKAVDIKTVENVTSSMPVPPPMPHNMPKPPGQVVTPPPVIAQKPKIKKQSRWGRTTSSQPSIIPMDTNSQQQAVTQQAKAQRLSLEPQHSQELKLSLSEDKSIDVQHAHDNKQHLQVIDEEYIDPLDQYMMDIEGQAAAQLELPKNSTKKVITFEQVVTNENVQTQKTPSTVSAATKQLQQDKFKQMFLSAIQKIGQKQEPNSDQDLNRGEMIENNQQRESDFQNAEQQKVGQLDFFAKQRKMAQRKDLAAVDHKNIEYEEVKFNLYRQAQEIKNMNYKDVVKYRKQAGDIKVRGKEILNPIFNWYQCGLSDKLLAVIQKRQYSKPFPIQAQTLPLIMSGRDVIGIAETGSGKTLSYLLPALKHVMSQRPVEEGEGPIAIIMTPTRQLARQVYLEAKHFIKSTTVRVVSVYGGLSVQTQLADLKKGAELIICTPGRMLDILTLNKGRVTNLKRLSMIVIDEADRMFDLGFEPQINKIIQNSRPRKQVVLFSATFPKNVQMLARRILVNPCEVIVGSRGQACTNVQQIVVVLQQTSKFLKLLQILGQWNEKGSILIFVDKQTEVDYLFQQLLKYGYHALTLHGAMDHDDREFTIYDFKKGMKSIMVATSICARGLDIKAICLVVNFKCPNHLEDYIHRIGRTGRAGTKGTAITFITPEQEQYSIDLMKALQMSQTRPPEELIKLSQTYMSKVKKGQARKVRNKNLMGSGFKFDQEEQQRVNVIKAALKKQLKSQGLVGGFDDSDEEDIEMKKKKQENMRGRNQQDRIAQALKNPQIKNRLVSEAVKAVSEAMKSNNKLSTQKILQIAIGSMKQSVTKQKVVTSVEDGVEKVTQLINEFQNKGIEGADFFSYDFEINDYPLNARQKACNQSFLRDVQQQTNCSVSLRGVYVQPGKKAPIGCRKLYLHIQGENKYYVTTAYKEIKGVLQQNAYESLHSGSAPGKYTL